MFIRDASTLQPEEALPNRRGRGRPKGSKDKAPRRSYPRRPRAKQPNQHTAQRRLGAYSLIYNFAKLDLRSNAGLLVKRVHDDLLAHLGHPPSAVERVYIERCCWLTLRLAFLDKKIAAHEDLGVPDSNYYLAWHNSLVRTLARLGIQSPASRPSLASIISEADAP